jgi:hypothetical protein
MVTMRAGRLPSGGLLWRLPTEGDPVGSLLGYSVIELLFTLGVLLTISAAVVPQTLAALDRHRLVGATRFVSTRLQQARLEAVVRATDVGIRFTVDARGYTMTWYEDGNSNGISSAEILDGTDRPVATEERLPEHFRDVDFGIVAGLSAIDPGDSRPTGDPIKFGASDIVTFTPYGTSSSGTLYLAGPGGREAAVRLFGATGKVRALEYDRATATWMPM